MASDKTYQVTYKVFGNEKIKNVSFHGKLVAPLYIQLIFDRRNTVYKCNLFDLYLKPKYGIRVAGELFPPPLAEVIRREEKLVEFIIDRHPDDFSFDLFKKEYDYYSRDLLDEMEPGFQRYLHTFFQDEGMPAFADALNTASIPAHLGDLVMDFKRSLKPDLYARLIENSFSYSPPYLPLFRFIDKPQRNVPLGLLLMDWENGDVRKEFADFILKYFPTESSVTIIDFIDKYLALVKRAAGI
jgi:hypothetical protein